MSKPEIILAIDYGKKRIGLAVSDKMKMIATPIGLIQAKSSLKETVKLLKAKMEQVVIDRGAEISLVVVGMPYRLSGGDSAMTEEVKKFITLLQEEIETPIKSWDERLTSKLAEQSLKERGLNRKKRTKQVDTIAATLVLQNYLDSLRFDL